MIDYSGVPTEQLEFMLDHNTKRIDYLQQVVRQFEARGEQLRQALRWRAEDQAVEEYRSLSEDQES